MIDASMQRAFTLGSSLLFGPALLLLSVACDEPARTKPSSPRPTSSAAPDTPPLDHTLLRVRELAQRSAMLRSRLDPADLADLERGLVGGAEARLWAVFGLGAACPKAPERIEALLTARAATELALSDAPTAELLHRLSRSLGSCATPSAEATLAGWLGFPPGPLASTVTLAAASGLATLASSRHSLSERTEAALLDAAEREKQRDYLAPFSEITVSGGAISARLLEVAGELIVSEAKGPRLTAIVALAAAGPAGTEPLAQVIDSTKFTPEERAMAAHTLGKMGAPGHDALDRVAKTLLERGVPTSAASPEWAPLRAVLDGLDLPDESRGRLREMATIPLPEAADQLALRRRLIWLRCRSADLAAGDKTLSQPLQDCDPEHGLEFELSQLRVLARSDISGPRREVLGKRAASNDPRVVQAALRLLPGHAEVKKADDLLLAALRSPEPGTRTTALQVIAAYPARAIPEKATRASDELLGALRKLTEENQDTLPTELRSALLSAVGALGVLTLKPFVETECQRGRLSLVGPAERALALLGSPKATCSVRFGKAAPTPSDQAKPSRYRVTFPSDVGSIELLLDAPNAPIATEHIIAALAAASGPLFVQRTSPGFAVQFGDPNGDGYDAEPSTEVPPELSALPGAVPSVLVSGFSPSESSIQILVLLTDAPEVTERRVRIGSASGPLALLFPGDSLGQPSVTPLD